MTNQTTISDIIVSRRTINSFQDKSVPESMIIKAIEHARWAPNHRLTEPWHFYLLGTETRKQVKQLITDLKSNGKSDGFRASTRKRLDGIPGWFVLTAEKSADKVMRRENYAATCCAAQNLMLYLWHEGIGVKWTTGDVTRDKRFYNLLGLNKSKARVVGLFWYGYPGQIPAQKRKSTDEIISILD